MSNTAREVYLSRYIHYLVQKANSRVPLAIKCILWYNRFYNLVAGFIWRIAYGETGEWAEVVGSYSENTCISGSDVDLLKFGGVVYSSESDIPKERLHGLVVVTDNDLIPPGCCWLRRERNENEDNISEDQFFECNATEIDGHTHYSHHNNMDKIICYRAAVTKGPDGQDYFSSKKFSDYHGSTGLTEYRCINRMLPQWNAHGPAFTQTYCGCFTVDVALCFRYMEGWPQSAEEWCTRDRIFGWPSIALIQDIMESGFDIVAIPSKITPPDLGDLEWRISFRMAETKLIKSFTPSQRVCFLLLKIITKQYIEPKFPDLDLISTYIMKTLMLWMVEETEEGQWNVDNTLSSLRMCLRRLRKWVQDRHCPSYFIPKYNLFRTKLEALDEQGCAERLLNVLKDLENERTFLMNCEFFQEIRQLWERSDRNDELFVNAIGRKMFRNSERSL